MTGSFTKGTPMTNPDTPTAQPNERDHKLVRDILAYGNQKGAADIIAIYRAEIEAAARADERAKLAAERYDRHIADGGY